MASDLHTHSDRRTNRIFASACAVGGLAVLMLQEAPNWHATTIALGSLCAFTGLWFLPESRPAGPPAPRRIHVEIIPAKTPDTVRPVLLEGPPRQHGPSDDIDPPRPLAWLVPGEPVNRWSLRRWRSLRRA